MLFLAGDIGGTSTRLGLYSCREDLFCVEVVERYSSTEFSSLEEAIQKFLATHTLSHPLEALCIGVPGPVQQGAVRLTNLSWEFSEKSLGAACSVDKVRVVNDLYAVAAAVPHLGAADLLTLHTGGVEHGDEVITVLSPGTGLGHASAVRIGDRWEPLSSEGGHLDFAPRDELSLALLSFLFKKYQRRVSYERVLSGPGLENIYEFLGTTGEFSEPTLNGDDLAPLIAEAGLTGDSPRAVKTLDIFSRILGGYAGNCVLYNLSTGGVYLGGGIPPKLSEKLTDGALLEEYLRQGRMSPLVADAPLHIITNDQAGMLGAAVLAKELIS